MGREGRGGGSINTQLESCHFLGGEGGEGRGGQSTLNLERICEDFGRITSDNADLGGGVNRHSTWKGSAKTLEGSPQLGKDPQRPWKDRLNLERIAMTLEGSPQLGKDLQ